MLHFGNSTNAKQTNENCESSTVFFFLGNMSDAVSVFPGLVRLC